MRRLSLALTLLAVPALVAFRSTPMPGQAVNAQGKISSISTSAIRIRPLARPRARAATLECALRAGSPSLDGFGIGELATIDCRSGVLTDVVHGVHAARGEASTLRPVPGLAQPSLALTGLVPGAAPTAQRCAAAWNRTSGPSTRSAVGHDDPLGAIVAAGQQSVSFASGRLEGPVCSITFVLPGIGAISAVGDWAHGSVPVWTGDRESIFIPTTRTAFVVAPSGSIELG